MSFIIEEDDITEKIKSLDLSIKNLETLNSIVQDDDNWTIKKISQECIPNGWEEVFKEASDVLQCISDNIFDKSRNTFFPLKRDIFRALRETPLNKVRVVLFGQDPFHNVSSNDGLPAAMGLSFSTRRGENIQPSTRNMYNEIKRVIPDFIIPDHGDLTGWARQGILLLNISLTVEPGQPNSHGKFKIWLPFIQILLKAIAKIRPQCIYLLFGKDALSINTMINQNAKKIICSHPSPFSFNRGEFPFNQSGFAALIDKYLIEQGDKPIYWNILSLLRE